MPDFINNATPFKTPLQKNHLRMVLLLLNKSITQLITANRQAMHSALAFCFAAL
jgi:hypothetical protein